MKALSSKLAYVVFVALAVISTAAVGSQVDLNRSGSPSKHVTHAGNGGG